ncbi:MAG: hypothetical protein WDZ93_04225 [Candidatus Paceibacterota bacterium]
MGFEGAHNIPKKKEEVSSAGKLARAAALGAMLSTVPTDAIESKADHFQARQIAAEQLDQTGITSERKEANRPTSLALERGFSPFGYTDPNSDGRGWDALSDAARIIKGLAVGTIKDENEQTRHTLVDEMKERFNISEEAANRFFDSRMDAFRLYLGLPQEHNTFGVSEYQPSQSEDDKYYYKINNFVENFSDVAPGASEAEEMTPERKREVMRWLWMNASGGYDAEFPQVDLGSGVMGRYSLMRGEDEEGTYVSYYDKWDMGGSIEGIAEDGVAGKPFEIYDRIYIEDPAVYEDMELEVVRRDKPEGQ